MIKKSVVRKIWAVGVLVLALVAGAAIGLVVLLWPKPVALDSEYYGTSEMLSLDKDTYEQMLKDRKSFVVMVDNAGCVTTARMREMMANMPEDLGFKYYQLMWPEAMESSLHNYVKYYPSIVIIDNGQVMYYLQADADEDSKYYNDTEALQQWLKERVDFRK